MLVIAVVATVRPVLERGRVGPRPSADENLRLDAAVGGGGEAFGRWRAAGGGGVVWVESASGLFP